MDDDFNTALVMGVLAEPLKLINDLLHTKKGRRRPGRLSALTRLREVLGTVFSVIGVGQADPATILAEMKAVHLGRMGLTEDDIRQRVDERNAARADKEWARADELRDALLEQRVQLMDAADGTSWRPVYEAGEDEEATAESPEASVTSAGPDAADVAPASASAADS